MNLKTKKYIFWMSLNSCVESCAFVLSTNSMLSSIMATPSYTTVIATTYVGKDIIGQLGGMIYGWRNGKKADVNPVPYITKGSIMQHTGCHLENASILVQNADFVLPFLGLSSILKNTAFISIGAVSASNIQKLSEKNIGELYSKVAGINTLASTLGMLSGIGIIHGIPCYETRSYAVLPTLTAISLYCVRKATKIANNQV